jgi:hypothetical protein
MVTKKKTSTLPEKIEEVPKKIEEKVKKEYENKREFEVIISVKNYYSFNWLGINRRFRRFLEKIKERRNKKEVQKENKIKQYLPKITSIPSNIWKKYCITCQKVNLSIISNIWENYCNYWNKKCNQEMKKNE